MRWLKPVKSWPVFVGEIAIIVIGVLIALSAEEIVQRLNWKEQVSQARASLDTQLAESQAAALERIADSECDSRIIDRLDELIAGKEVPEMDLSRLASLRPWGTSAWDAASASGAVAHMTPEVRNLYADLFHFTAMLGVMNRQEFETASDLRTMERHRELTDTSRDRLSRELSRLRSYNQMMALGAAQWVENAKPLRLQLPEAATKDLERIQSRPCNLPDEPVRG